MIESRVRAAIRDINDFPKQGIVFKDITPILLNPELCSDVVDYFVDRITFPVNAIAAIESRGFFFGTLLAQRLEVPFIPIRKEGKLPGDTAKYSYSLEYGSATIEIHNGHLRPGEQVLIHDDLLATGGTAVAASELVKEQGATVAGFSFLVTLGFLEGKKRIKNINDNLISIVEY